MNKKMHSLPIALILSLVVAFSCGTSVKTVKVKHGSIKGTGTSQANCVYYVADTLLCNSATQGLVQISKTLKTMKAWKPNLPKEKLKYVNWVYYSQEAGLVAWYDLDNIFIWETGGRKVLHLKTKRLESFYGIEIDAANKLLYVGKSNAISKYDLKGKLIKEYKFTGEDFKYALFFHIHLFDGGRKMAIGGFVHVYILDVRKNELKILKKIPSKGVPTLAINSSRTMFAFLTSESGLALYNLKSGKLKKVKLPGVKAFTPNFSRDGQNIFLGEHKRISVYSVKKKRLTYNFPTGQGTTNKVFTLGPKGLVSTYNSNSFLFAHSL